MGKANPSALPKRLCCSLPGLQKRNSHPSALSHSPLSPKERVISCLGLWAAQAPVMGCASLISPQALSQSLAGVVWSSCFLSRKHGFRKSPAAQENRGLSKLGLKALLLGVTGGYLGILCPFTWIKSLLMPIFNPASSCGRFWPSVALCQAHNIKYRKSPAYEQIPFQEHTYSEVQFVCKVQQS